MFKFKERFYGGIIGMMEMGMKGTLRGIHFYFDSPVSVTMLVKGIYNWKRRLINTFAKACT